MLTEYDIQAKTFLEKADTLFKIEKSNIQDCPKWGKCEPYLMKFDMMSTATLWNCKKLEHNHGIKYDVIISRNNYEFKFPFWSSLADSYRRDLKSGRDLKPLIPTAYDVLACLSSNIDTHIQTFDEFCSNLGYDTDSIKAKETYDLCCDESRKMSRIWNDEELDQLREIN